jgi:hypothetical protein
MAGTNLQSLVLCGLGVASDVVARNVRLGFNQAERTAPALLSHPRRQSHGPERTGYQPASRRIFIDSLDEDTAGMRAGRPGSRASVLVRRGPATVAGPAVLFGWPCADGVTCATAKRSCGISSATAPATSSMRLRGRLRSHSLAGATDMRLMPRFKRIVKRWESRLAMPMPGGRTSSASTRGSGDR